MTVAFTPPWQARVRKPIPQPRRARRVRQAGETPRPELSEPDEHQTVEAPQPLANGLGGGAGRALRDLLGCEHAAFLGLSFEERQRCEDRMTAYRKTTAPFQLNLDPRGLYVVNPEPYLNRKPKNGCKVRAGGDVGPMGQQGAVAGISCGKSF